MYISGWGKNPIIESKIATPFTEEDVLKFISKKSKKLQKPLIARGTGRSYGDCSLAQHTLSTTYLNHFLEFNEKTGELTCMAGVKLADILAVFVPKGWFLTVTPYTKFVTVGGAVASDAHGSNHRCEGTFSEHVSQLRIATISDGIIECSRKDYSDLFHASCGGMGLTGVILTVTLKLKPIQSTYINTKTIKAKSLEEVVELLETHSDTHYSTAWFDCLASEKLFGRTLLVLGEHAKDGKMTMKKLGKLLIPLDIPNFLMNRHTVGVFNKLYYQLVNKPYSKSRPHYERHFYPLDGIRQWNNLYGKKGFTRYQFVLPKSAGLEGITQLMERIKVSNRLPFLAVLKALGKTNKNYLSFPMEGYTITLDFKLDEVIVDLLNELDKIVLDYGGRINLADDIRMSEETFKQSYSEWDKFMDIRTNYGADSVFHSLQSARLGI